MIKTFTPNNKREYDKRHNAFVDLFDREPEVWIDGTMRSKSGDLVFLGRTKHKVERARVYRGVFQFTLDVDGETDVVSPSEFEWNISFD